MVTILYSSSTSQVEYRRLNREISISVLSKTERSQSSGSAEGRVGQICVPFTAIGLICLKVLLPPAIIFIPVMMWCVTCVNEGEVTYVLKKAYFGLARVPSIETLQC